MYLDKGQKSECFGCEGCVQICPTTAISMQEDSEGFRYPVVDNENCIGCDLCRKACPFEHMPDKYEDNQDYGRT